LAIEIKKMFETFESYYTKIIKKDGKLKIFLLIFSALRRIESYSKLIEIAFCFIFEKP
jgi:hypothetical protein